MRPGDAVRVTISYGQPIAAVEIPATAIRRDRDATGTMVYLAEAESDSETGSEATVLRAKVRRVSVAGGGGMLSRVVAGIEPGDRIVTDGSFKVREGALIASHEQADDDDATENTAATKKTTVPKVTRRNRSPICSFANPSSRSLST